MYIVFSRQPDYQDGEFTTGTIQYIQDAAKKPVAKAIFSVDKKTDTINAGYPFRKLKQGQQVRMIYDTSDPSKAAVYRWWGYWLQWDELLASVLIPIIFLYAAKTITAKPSQSFDGTA